MDAESVYKAGKEIAIKHTVDALIKKVPVLGVMFESYEAYKKATEEKLFNPHSASWRQ